MKSENNATEKTLKCEFAKTENGVFLVFENEDQAEDAAMEMPTYLRITSFGKFMNAVQIA